MTPVDDITMLSPARMLLQPILSTAVLLLPKLVLPLLTPEASTLTGGSQWLPEVWAGSKRCSGKVESL